jgi:hypothetical protein
MAMYIAYHRYTVLTILYCKKQVEADGLDLIALGGDKEGTVFLSKNDREGTTADCVKH